MTKDGLALLLSAVSSISADVTAAFANTIELAPVFSPVTTWHLVWTGGQSNSQVPPGVESSAPLPRGIPPARCLLGDHATMISCWISVHDTQGTNSQTSGYPVWPTTQRIQASIGNQTKSSRACPSVPRPSYPVCTILENLVQFFAAAEFLFVRQLRRCSVLTPRDHTFAHTVTTEYTHNAVHTQREGTFRPATVPLYNEVNVGFSQTFANLLLPTLPPDEGIILLNTGVGGTGRHVHKR